jgi:hypothetical protein
MVKKSSTKKVKGKHRKATTKKSEALVAGPIIPITPNTPYGQCSERLSAFGGLLALVKFLELISFEELFAQHYVRPKRQPKLGSYRMVAGILMLLFIGFQRLGHFAYVRMDPMLCGILGVASLPVVSTFWRYLRSMAESQSKALIGLGGALRAKVWALCQLKYRSIHIDIDTTTTTVYGQIEGGRMGQGGHKGLRPVLCFINETREYLCGSQRQGTTITNQEMVEQIRQSPKLLPKEVKKVQVRADGEFIGWNGIQACEEAGYTYIIGNRRCTPVFKKNGWYRHGEYDYNQTEYQPHQWSQARRFVVMRLRKQPVAERQLSLLVQENYSYRVFVTNETKKAHLVIAEYDGRAGVEPLIGEAQREGVLAIASKKFATHHAFFQVVMLAYNIWRWMKLLAGHQQQSTQKDTVAERAQRVSVLPEHTLRIARLKMLFVAAKLCVHSNRGQVYYSIHEARATGLIDFMKYLDKRRAERMDELRPLAA